MSILDILKKELSYLPRKVDLSLNYVSQLPFLGDENFFHKDSKTGRYWLPWNDQVGAWVYDEGSTVNVVAQAESEISDISGTLTLGLSSVITGSCLNLENQVAIHANAISLAGKAIAFVGESGVGKSTLSTYCACQGAGFVTDDVLVVDPDGLVHPGNPRIKLYPSTAKSLGLDVSGETLYKLFYEPAALGAKLHQSAIPIGTIYLPVESSSGDIYAETLSPSKAAYELLANSYHAIALIPERPFLFDAYLRLVQQASVKKLFYPRDFEQLPNVYKFLLEEIHSL